MSYASVPVGLDDAEKGLDSDEVSDLMIMQRHAGKVANDNPLPATTGNVTRALVSGSWFGVKGLKVNREDLLNEWTNIAIICGLCAALSGSGMFAAFSMQPFLVEANPLVQKAYLIAWCVATLGFTTAMLGYIGLMIGLTECRSRAEFIEWVRNIGSYARIPLCLALMSAASLYLGICFLFWIQCGIALTIQCVVTCIVLLCLPGVVGFTVLVWAVLKTRHKIFYKSIPMADCDPDFIYSELRKYFLEECNGKLGLLSRDVFMHRFRVHGEVGDQLVAKIYDHWLNKKLDALVREDVGF